MITSENRAGEVLPPLAAGSGSGVGTTTSRLQIGVGKHQQAIADEIRSEGLWPEETTGRRT